jgi:hypothetical protein
VESDQRTLTGPRLVNLRRFLETEAGGAVILLAATLGALIWANSPWRDTYQALWSSEISVGLGEVAFSYELGHLVNDGLMAFFFLLIGLEIRRGFDMGELRERRRVAVPVVAAMGGMAVPGADLPGPQSEWGRGARLGDGDGDRHALRPRRPRARRSPRLDAAQDLPADAGHCR